MGTDFAVTMPGVLVAMQLSNACMQEIEAKICGYEYGCEISYLRQACEQPPHSRPSRRVAETALEIKRHTFFFFFSSF